MTDWQWFRQFRNEERRATFAKGSGNTFLFDGDSLLLLDRNGKETQVGSDEEIEERQAFGAPTLVAISPTALYMACYFKGNDDSLQLSIYNRRGKPVSSTALNYPLESLEFEEPELLVGVVDNQVVKQMFSEPLRLSFAIAKGKEITPEIDPQGQELVCRHKDHSVHHRGKLSYEIQRRSKQRATFDATESIRLVHFSPTGKSFSALEGAAKLVTYSLDGTVLGTIEAENDIDDFRYYEDGSIVYICNDRMVKIGPTGNLLWHKSHPTGVRGSGRVDADSGYFLVYFEAEGAYHSWVYDIFGNVLQRHESNYPHHSKLFTPSKSLWLWERGRVGLLSLYGDDWD